MHYGVKGMKWEHHKYVNENTANREKRRERVNQFERDMIREHQQEYLRNKHANHYDKAIQKKEYKNQHDPYKKLEKEINGVIDKQDSNFASVNIETQKSKRDARVDLNTRDKQISALHEKWARESAISRQYSQNAAKRAYERTHQEQLKEGNEGNSKKKIKKRVDKIIKKLDKILHD